MEPVAKFYSNHENQIIQSSRVIALLWRTVCNTTLIWDDRTIYLVLLVEIKFFPGLQTLNRTCMPWRGFIILFGENKVYPYFSWFHLMVFLHMVKIKGIVVWEAGIVCQTYWQDFYFFTPVSFPSFFFIPSYNKLNKVLHFRNYAKIRYTTQKCHHMFH